jgi:hypothetical protein
MRHRCQQSRSQSIPVHAVPATPTTQRRPAVNERPLIAAMRYRGCDERVRPAIVSMGEGVPWILSLKIPSPGSYVAGPDGLRGALISS